MIAAFTDVVIFDCLQHCTARFIKMQAVVIFTVFRYPEYFREIVRYFGTTHIDGTKTFDTRGINQKTTILQFDHLRKSGGMHPFVMITGYLTHFLRLTSYQEVDDARFSHPRMPCK